MTVKHLYAYGPAPARGVGGVFLATSGGLTEYGPRAHPHLFGGSLRHPQQNVAALSAVGQVGRTRFYPSPAKAAPTFRAVHPVATSSVDRLRFESFSTDGGVYCRLDLLPDSLDGVRKSGTTNVDVNAVTKAVLAGIGADEPLPFSVGAPEEATTALPDAPGKCEVILSRVWLRGFADVHVAAAAMAPRLRVSDVEARRFLQSLPHSRSRGEHWVVRAGRGLRLTSSPRREAVCLAGPERLQFLAPLARYCRELVAYGPPDAAHGIPTASAWELRLDDATLVVALSPELERGFTGDSGVLADLTDAQTFDDANLLARCLGWSSRLLEPMTLSRCTGLDLDRVQRGLQCLAAAGRVGFDLAASTYFRRELPYDSSAVYALHPRLRHAHELVRAGAVCGVAGEFLVTTDVTHRVRLDRSPPSCTCRWWGRHRGQRGPCEHVLAAQLSEGI